MGSKNLACLLKRRRMQIFIFENNIAQLELYFLEPSEAITDTKIEATDFDEKNNEHDL